MKIFIHVVVAAFSIFILLVSCESRHDVAGSLDNASRIIDDMPDSALVILESIKAGELSSEADRAKFALLMSQAVDKNYMNHESDSLIRIAVKYYDKKGSSLERANSYYMLGRIYNDMDSLKPAINAFIEASKYAEQAGDNILGGLISYQIGAIYHDKQWDFAKAGEMFDKSIKYFDLANDSMRKAMVISALARNYSFEEKYQEAVESYREAMDIYRDLDSRSNILHTASAIASVYYQNLGEGEQALQILHDIYEEYNDGEIPVDHYPMLSYINHGMGNVDSAILFLDRYLDEPGINLTDKLGTYYLRSQYEASRENYEKAFHDLEYALHLSDSIDKVVRTDLIREIERKYEKQELQNRYESLHKISNLQRVISFLVIFIIALILLRVIANRRRVVAEKNRNIEELEAYVDNLNSQISEVDDLRHRLSGVLSEKDEKEKRLKEVLNNKVQSTRQILELASMHSNNPELFMKKFQKDIWKVSQEEYFGDMHEIVNDRFFGIINYLHEHYPKLNGDDLNLCCLICFGFSNNQISLLFGHTNPDSIFTKRHKLRKKLGLWGSNISLESFIAEVLTQLEAESRGK